MKTPAKTDEWVYNQFCPGYHPTRLNTRTGAVQVGECLSVAVEDRPVRKFWAWRTVAQSGL